MFYNLAGTSAARNLNWMEIISAKACDLDRSDHYCGKSKRRVSYIYNLGRLQRGHSTMSPFQKDPVTLTSLMDAPT